MLEKYILMANSALLKVKGIAGEETEGVSQSTVLAVSPPASHAASAQQDCGDENGKRLAISVGPGTDGAVENTPAMSKSSTRTPRSHLLRLIKIQEDAWSPSSKVSRDEKTAAIISMSMNKSKGADEIPGVQQSDALDLLSGGLSEEKASEQ